MRHLHLLATAAIGLASAPLLADNHGGANGHMQGDHAMHGDGQVPMYAEDVLAAYYAKLEQRTDLPVAPANVTLSPDAAITRNSLRK